MPLLHSSRQPAERLQWFDTGAAQRLMAIEQREVIPLLTAHIGVRGLFLRPSAATPAALSGNMLQSIAALHRGRGSAFAGELECDEHALPFENESLCMIYALHAFETAEQVDALVVEAERTLRPEGVLFAIGLSPHSLWRFRWRPAGVRALAAPALRARLSKAGLGVELQLGLGPMWPGGLESRSGSRPDSANAGRALDPLRPGYLLVARKRRRSLTPIGRRAPAAVRRLNPQVRPG